MSTHNQFRKQNSLRKGDAVIVCDFCGAPGYASEMVIRDQNTGKGGTIIHKEHTNVIDYMLFPIEIPEARYCPLAKGKQANIANPDPVVPIDYTTTDPMSLGGYSQDG